MAAHLSPDYPTLSDVQLMDLLKDGNHAAFTEILKQYTPLLINFAYKRVADLPLAEDLVHDVFVYLWEKRTQIQLNKGLAPFVFTATRNRILDHFKRQKISQRYIENFRHFLSHEHNTADYLIRHRDLEALIEREIAALPENMRKVFELSRKSYMNSQEISVQLNMPENSVKSNMQRALRILKRRLDGAFIFVFLI